MPLIVLFEIVDYIDDQSVVLRRFQFAPWLNQPLPVRLMDILVPPGQTVDRRNAKVVFRFRQEGNSLVIIIWFEENLDVRENVRPPIRL